MKKDFKEFKKKVHAVFPFYAGKKMLIAVSGGPDSMALLHFFYHEGCDVTAAHVNYGLRGKESDRDESMVSIFCKQNNIKFICLDAKKEIVFNQSGIQEKARQIRYTFFEKVRIKLGLDYILTAHHADDNAETFIFNLLRGSGLQGLQGIPSNRGYIVRPFLLLTKKEIFDYVDFHKIPYTTDTSNLKNAYTRNRIRKNIVPEMERENPNATLHIARSAFLISGYREWMSQYFNQLKKKIIKKKENHFEIILPEKIGTAKKICLLYEILTEYGFASQQIFQLTRVSGFPEGQQFESDRFILKVLPKKIILTEKISVVEKKSVFITRSIKGKWPDFIEAKVIKKIPADIKTDKLSVILPADKLEFPLKWRHPKAGDFFRPFGMKGKKKISDFLKDEGIKSPLKDRIWLLTDNNEKIIWVTGLRLNDEFRTEGNEKVFLRLRVKKHQKPGFFEHGMYL